MNTRVYIETMGCQMNVADTERAESRLRSSGFELTNSSMDADVVLFNSCSVRERAAQKVFNRIGEVRKQRRHAEPLFGVMGCVAQLEGETLFGSGSPIKLVAGTRATDRIPQLLSEMLESDSRVIDLGERKTGEIWDIAADERRSPYVAFVPIIEGCNKFCTYCIVPFSRGREKSRPAIDILHEVAELKAAGYKEIHLIGQNVNSYRPLIETGIETVPGATPFSRLLRAVAATGMERIKFTTSFPRDFHPDIVAAMDESDNLCNWIHLPVQSGSNRVLKSMRRGYTRENYLERIERIRSAKRQMSITTDIIVGFPGETDSNFDETLSLVQACQYDSLYAFKYSIRPGTPAAALGNDVTEDAKGARLASLLEVQKHLQRPIFESYVGRIVKVLVEGKSAKCDEDLTGHTTCHKVVNFRADREKVGKVLEVIITEAKENSLYGSVSSELR
jgi:tRNA-2-methylthio-N6-dimethylallyladenosine synthase